MRPARMASASMTGRRGGIQSQDGATTKDGFYHHLIYPGSHRRPRATVVRDGHRDLFEIDAFSLAGIPNAGERR